VPISLKTKRPIFQGCVLKNHFGFKVFVCRNLSCGDQLHLYRLPQEVKREHQGALPWEMTGYLVDILEQMIPLGQGSSYLFSSLLAEFS
jgi:hypothetical protein